MTSHAFVVEVREYNSAIDFFQALSPANPQWGHGLGSDWAFRGHGDSRWELTPSAWRTPPPDLIRQARDRIIDLLEDSVWTKLDSFGTSLGSAMLNELLIRHDKRNTLAILAQRLSEQEIVATLPTNSSYVEKGPKSNSDWT